MSSITENATNRWRLEAPGHAGRERTARPGDPRKYFMVSTDEHVNEPATLRLDRMDRRYHDRLPRVITDERGVPWRICEGYRPDRLRLSQLEDEDLVRSRAGDCLVWGNDYPHHEGAWPHSAPAIERTMGELTDAQRAKVLGLNAARLVGFRAP
jgi:hypothetical protein